ncbi:MAG TPA: molybdopterin-dependent oxidoreductase, partial [Fimbriimonadaceae bacterium]|nr:molybdopterin-dependent oxidoreductase [Fimbriimonadaceae bacterium]
MTRRELLKSLGGGLLVAVAAPIGLAQGVAGGRQGGGAQTPQTIAAWLHIGPDGKITVYSGKVEVGQNARTNIGQAAAEELRVPFEAITVVLGDTDLCPFDQGTFGSRTTPAMLPQIRQAAASAREALEALAAKEWEVDASKVIAMDGKVVWIEGDSNSSVEKSITYGELAKRLPASQPVKRDVSLTPTSDWKLMGTNAPKADGIEIVTGARKYSIDMRRPGMLHAKVLRPPSLGAELTSVDDSIAVAMPGVRVVRDGSFVAVAARTLRLAERAIASIKAEWSEKPQPSNAQLWDILKGESSQWTPEAEATVNEDEPWLVQEPSGWSLNADHRPPASLTLDMTPRVHVDSDTGGISLKSSYRCPYIAHFPLEPRAALAEFDGTKMTV